eukprot:766421-Hanusia_phi.AAC.11
MGRYSNDGFLTALDKQFNRVRTQGSLFVTLKRSAFSTILKGNMDGLKKPEKKKAKEGKTKFEIPADASHKVQMAHSGTAAVLYVHALCMG